MAGQEFLSLQDTDMTAFKNGWCEWS